MSREKIVAVQRMQDYIAANLNGCEAFSYAGLYAAAGYSKRHARRIFKEVLGKTPCEYVTLLRLSATAGALAYSGESILEIALASNYQTHEGYTKAFSKLFGALPNAYRRGQTPIPLFLHYPVSGVYPEYFKKEENPMEKQTFLCMVSPVSRPERKLLLLRAQSAKDYWGFCEEKTCEWEGLLNSIPSRLGSAAILTLPDFLMKPGFGRIAAGLEVPFFYEGKVPDGYELVTLPPCEMLFFRVPCTKNNFFEALGQAFCAAEKYESHFAGYTLSPNLAPAFNFGGGEKGFASLAFPCVKQEA